MSNFKFPVNDPLWDPELSHEIKTYIDLQLHLDQLLVHYLLSGDFPHIYSTLLNGASLGNALLMIDKSIGLYSLQPELIQNSSAFINTRDAEIVSQLLRGMDLIHLQEEFIIGIPFQSMNETVLYNLTRETSDYLLEMILQKSPLPILVEFIITLNTHHPNDEQDMALVELIDDIIFERTQMEIEEVD